MFAVSSSRAQKSSSGLGPSAIRAHRAPSGHGAPYPAHLISQVATNLEAADHFMQVRGDVQSASVIHSRPGKTRDGGTDAFLHDTRKTRQSTLSTPALVLIP